MESESPPLSSITRRAAESALDEHDRLGAAAFLTKHG